LRIHALALALRAQIERRARAHVALAAKYAYHYATYRNVDVEKNEMATISLC
jgi:hypothetical protein